MSETESDVYAAPEAEIESPERVPEFFAIDMTKFYVMTIGTMGIYFLYWFWKQWKIIKVAKGLKVKPILRTIFSIFYTHSLFKRFKEGADVQGDTFSAWSSTQIATLFILLGVFSWLASFVPESNIGLYIFGMLLSVVLAVIQAFMGAKAQKVANFAAGDPEGSTNTSYSPGNIFWLVVGGLLWLTIIASLAMFSVLGSML